MSLPQPADPEPPAADGAPPAVESPPVAADAGTLSPAAEPRFGAFAVRMGQRNVASAIYGEILVLSLLAAFTPSEVSSSEVLIEVVVTQFVFWVGHAYAEVVAAQIEIPNRRVGRDMVWETMRRQSPLATAAIPAAVIVALAVIGLISLATAITIAFVYGVVALFGFGLQAARQRSRALSAQLLSASLSAGFGLVIVALKVLSHH
jgi:hypothetical protein